MCTTCNPLHKAADRAATEAIGARRLLEAITGRLNAETHTEAAAYCDALETKAKEAQAAFQASLVPVVYATQAQWQQLSLILNSEHVKSFERTKIYYHWPRTTEAQATALIADWRQEVARRHAGEGVMQVVASAEFVRPLAA